MAIQVVLLEQRRLVEGTEDVVKQLEGTLCPDNEPAKVTAWCKLQEVESPHVDELNTREVTECLDNTVIVHNQGATTLVVVAITHLTLAGPEFPGVGHFDNVSIGVQGLEERYSLWSFEGLGRGDDKRNFLKLLNVVAMGKDKQGEGRCSESGNDSKAMLVLVYFDMPLMPGRGGGAQDYCQGARVNYRPGDMRVEPFDRNKLTRGFRRVHRMQTKEHITVNKIWDQ
jgi:hypothetical protein